MSEPRDILKHFTADTAEHVLTVIKEDGLYRHLRCSKPGTMVYRFDIITWPGYLAYVGDMGDYVFSRTDDMLGFFGSDGINPGYWSEKCVAVDHSDGIREFSVDKYRQLVEEWRDEVAEDITEYEESDNRGEFVAAVKEELLDCADDLTEQDAHQRLSEFKHEDITADLSWEWDFRRFAWRYIWACYAITWAIGQYRTAVSS